MIRFNKKIVIQLIALSCCSGWIGIVWGIKIGVSILAAIIINDIFRDVGVIRLTIIDNKVDK